MKMTATTSLATLARDPEPIPTYLDETYWWAYVNPGAIRFFERQWLVSLILWGNFSRLRDSTIDALGVASKPGRTLQVACVYGDLTERLIDASAAESTLDVLDVVPAQLTNLRRKLPARMTPNLIRCDSSKMQFESASYDRTLLFFLLHEMPEDVRRATLAHAFRVTKPGGRIVLVDYHHPQKWHPLYWAMRGILKGLEPFALDLWRNELATYFPTRAPIASMTTTTSFGGLYQLLTIDIAE